MQQLSPHRDEVVFGIDWEAGRGKLPLLSLDADDVLNGLDQIVVALDLQGGNSIDNFSSLQNLAQNLAQVMSF